MTARQPAPSEGLREHEGHHHVRCRLCGVKAQVQVSLIGDDEVFRIERRAALAEQPSEPTETER